jgi:hypothetical protein
VIRQTSTVKNLIPAIPAQLELTTDACPSCGQAVPPDKLEEISGRIAARDREQISALTARFEQQFAVEKAKADAKAKADIEIEKRQSVEREAKAVEKAKSDAAAELRIKLAEAERVRMDLLAADQKKLDAATAPAAADTWVTVGRRNRNGSWLQQPAAMGSFTPSVDERIRSTLNRKRLRLRPSRGCLVSGGHLWLLASPESRSRHGFRRPDLRDWWLYA